MSEHISIFCATDENYAPFASIMMKSILMHTDSFVDFYIMDGGIKKKTKKLIDKDLKKYPNKELHFVDMKKYDFSQFPSIAPFTVNTYSRYFIPDIAPHLDKAIYLDVDTIVKKDIKILFELDMGEYPIAAISETDYFTKHTINMLRANAMPNYKETSAYFNSGVLLLDIQKLIAMDFTKKAAELTSQLYSKISFPDQDILNILFEDNYKKLDYRFNFLHNELVAFKAKYPRTTLDDLVIIHYTGPKPWKEYSPFKQDFDAVAKTSIFYKQIVKKYRSPKASKFYLLGFIPLFKKTTPKNS